LDRIHIPSWFCGNPEVENQFRVARYWKFPEDDQAQEATAISNGK